MKISSFQFGVGVWQGRCFGHNAEEDKGMTRNFRFFEEATELVQAGLMSREDAHKLVDYVYDRPIGEKHQEVGGVSVTLAAWCNAHMVCWEQAVIDEFRRINTPEMMEKIRQKQATKMNGSPLPGTVMKTTGVGMSCPETMAAASCADAVTSCVDAATSALGSTVPILDDTRYCISPSTALTFHTGNLVATKVINIHEEEMEQLEQAVTDSSWIPKEYSRSEWIADACEFLRNGKSPFREVERLSSFPVPDPVTEPYKWSVPVEGPPTIICHAGGGPKDRAKGDDGC